LEKKKVIQNFGPHNAESERKKGKTAEEKTKQSKNKRRGPIKSMRNKMHTHTKKRKNSAIKTKKTRKIGEREFLKKYHKRK